MTITDDYNFATLTAILDNCSEDEQAEILGDKMLNSNPV